MLPAAENNATVAVDFRDLFIQIKKKVEKASKQQKNINNIIFIKKKSKE
jgi:hypothetical protein